MANARFCQAIQTVVRSLIKHLNDDKKKKHFLNIIVVVLQLSDKHEARICYMKKTENEWMSGLTVNLAIRQTQSRNWYR